MKSISRCALLVALGMASFFQSSSASAELIYGVGTQGNSQFLVTWNSATPGTLVSSTPLVGGNPTDTMLGIDFRPATGQLYALAVTGQEYKVATISSGGFVSYVGATGVTVNGFSHGFDFNPTIDRIRVVTDTNKNYVLNPITGALQLAATDLAYGASDPNAGKDPNVGGSAYSNNFVGAATSQLYGIDTGLDILVTQANNAGTLGTVGPLGTDVSSLAGFDISGLTGIAYATMTPAGASQSSFYKIDLVTGAATSVGVVGGGVVITAMTVAPVPEPATVAGAAMALVALIGVRRRQG